MSGDLTPSRMEAFSDGVIAVIITIMVLEIHVPARSVSNLDGLRALAPVLFVYLLSFIQVGIYWVNHHYLIDDLKHVSHGILWTNLALLFLLSLFPAATAWVGERGISSFSICLYAIVSFLPGIPWFLLTAAVAIHFKVKPANGLPKMLSSMALYLGAIALAWVSPWISLALILIVSILWLLPPKAILEKSHRYMHEKP
jgi:uncharacterized membrane protein